MRLNGGMTTPQPAYYPQPAPMTPEDQRLWSTLVHVGGIFFYFVAPLVGYLVFKDRGGFIRQHTATALNFQITVAIAYFVSFILMFFFIGIFVLLAIPIVVIIFTIMAAIAANNGQPYKYPLAIEFVR